MYACWHGVDEDTRREVLKFGFETYQQGLRTIILGDYFCPWGVAMYVCGLRRFNAPDASTIASWQEYYVPRPLRMAQADQFIHDVDHDSLRAINLAEAMGVFTGYIEH